MDKDDFTKKCLDALNEGKEVNEIIAEHFNDLAESLQERVDENVQMFASPTTGDILDEVLYDGNISESICVDIWDKECSFYKSELNNIRQMKNNLDYTKYSKDELEALEKYFLYKTIYYDRKVYVGEDALDEDPQMQEIIDIAIDKKNNTREA